MPIQPPPPAEAAIDEDLIRALLSEQHPDLADEPLRRVAAGWDNESWRVGSDLVVRLPRREAAVPLVDHEQRWLPLLAPQLPLRVPTPVRHGQPSGRFPWPWTIASWVPGRPSAEDPPADGWRAAVDLGRFLAALHVPAPPDAPRNPYRGVPLTERDAAVRGRLVELDGVIDVEAVTAVWDAAVALPHRSGPPVWIHGDLHPLNVIVDGGHITGVIDFGDITAGDPATDLAVAWMLLPPATHGTFRAAVGIDDATWGRGQGWAVALGLAYLAMSAGNPTMAMIGRRTLDAVVADAQA